MAQSDTEVKAQFTRPWAQLFQILVVLALTCLGAYFAVPRVLPVFQANPYLNGFIAFVFVFGVLACLYQIYTLFGSVRWIAGFTDDSEEAGVAPQLLAPLATLLRTRGARMQINATSTRSILDSVATRIDEVRDITRYIVNLLIFLGLLGTFYGLATTVPGVVETIRGLAPQAGESTVDVFNRLMSGLETQLDGMGVAFASSLLGLAGSLVVGLLELFVGHGQNRFYRELEEWLSTITRVGFASGEDSVGGDAGAMVTMIDHMAEQMESLQQMFTQSDISRSMVDEKLGSLVDAVNGLTERMEGGGGGGGDGSALQRVAEGQEKLIALFEKQGPGEGIDAESRMRLRSIDVQMLRILEEISAGRQESMSEIRSDLNALTRAMSGERSLARRLRSGSDGEG